MALFLYTKGLSTRQVAQVLQQLGVEISHVVVWNWLCKYSQRGGPKSPLAPPAPADADTALQLGRRGIWLFLATDPRHRAIVYAEPHAGRGQWDRAIWRLYGRWPRRLVTDRGLWHRTVTVVLTAMEHIRMTRGTRNLVEPLHPTEEEVGKIRWVLPQREYSESEGVDPDLGWLLQPLQARFMLTALLSLRLDFQGHADYKRAGTRYIA